MKKAVIGIDPVGTYRPALELLLRLGIPDLQVTAVSVAEPVMADTSGFEAVEFMPVADLIEQELDNCEKRLNEVKADLEGRGVACTTVLESGMPLTEIEEEANKGHADLIVAGSEKKGFFARLFDTSVAEGLAIESKTSFLIGRAPFSETGKLRAVFATDHSEYCSKCIDLLLAMKPAGFGEIHILASFTPAEISFAYENAENLVDGHDSEMVREALEEKNNALASKLASLADKVTHEVVENHPNGAINAVMKEQNADLLIMGAHGHGLIERIFIGSVSMHQVKSEDHNILVMRA